LDAPLLQVALPERARSGALDAGMGAGHQRKETLVALYENLRALVGDRTQERREQKLLDQVSFRTKIKTLSFQLAACPGLGAIVARDFGKMCRQVIRIGAEAIREIVDPSRDVGTAQRDLSH
jgi:hypothetical protein